MIDDICPRRGRSFNATFTPHRQSLVDTLVGDPSRRAYSLRNRRKTLAYEVVAQDARPLHRSDRSRPRLCGFDEHLNLTGRKLQLDSLRGSGHGSERGGKYGIRQTYVPFHRNVILVRCAMSGAELQQRLDFARDITLRNVSRFFQPGDGNIKL